MEFKIVEPEAVDREIVFVDTRVEDYELIVADLESRATVEIVFLDSDRDGISQMADYLDGQSGVSAIHVVSHGSQAELQLGSALLTADSITGQHLADLESRLRAENESNCHRARDSPRLQRAPWRS